MEKFKVGDRVISMLSSNIFVITSIDGCNVYAYKETDKNHGTIFYSNGKDKYTDLYPMYVHYDPNYDYSKIDFNNLPKRVEWRAERGCSYKMIAIHEGIVVEYLIGEQNTHANNLNYSTGNYFHPNYDLTKRKEIIRKALTNRTNL